ncbi:type IV secretion system protein VirB7, putative [Anaplasma phagocytophilum str. HZ]|uniref:Type IV secretion system protein VirB7, putative n=5 Tax=Anaplasma phagocytophilum TaxID=948 RepID=F5GUJ8_ANAPZ|nr:type IV secretion system protein VirB7, putative [Anaplasma phagocytophilum str. HZ]
MVVMRFYKVLFLFAVVLVLQGCGGLFSKEERRIRSPCVRAGSGHECERHPVNKWLLR